MFKVKYIIPYRCNKVQELWFSKFCSVKEQETEINNGIRICSWNLISQQLTSDCVMLYVSIAPFLPGNSAWII
jgi:hypothetical protein